MPDETVNRVLHGPSWLVALSRTGSHPPLFLIHAIGGSTFPYVGLARRLARQCVGVEARGLHGHEPDGDIESSARAYTSAIRSVQASGPYLIGGWSLGGLLSFEVARCLKAVGEECFVLMLDTDPPWIFDGNADDSQLLLHYVRDVIRLAGRRGALAEIEKAHEPFSDVEDVTRFLVRTGIAPESMEDELKTRAAVSLSFYRGLGAYSPRPVALRGALLSTAAKAQQQAEAWQALATNGLAVYDIPGDHYSLLDGSNVVDVAARVRSAISSLGFS